MARTPTIPPAEYEKIKRMYTNGLVPMIKLAERYKVSRMAMWKLLHNKLGVDTEKNGGVDIVCHHCKKGFRRHKSRIRLRSNHKFCSRECWFAFVKSLTGTEYKYSRQGTKVARRVVGKYHVLQPEEVVHHEDKNTLNNTLGNLKVFRNQSDHIRYHRGFEVKPVWQGSDVIGKRQGKS